MLSDEFKPKRGCKHSNLIIKPEIHEQSYPEKGTAVIRYRAYCTEEGCNARGPETCDSIEECGKLFTELHRSSIETIAVEELTLKQALQLDKASNVISFGGRKKNTAKSNNEQSSDDKKNNDPAEQQGTRFRRNEGKPDCSHPAVTASKHGSKTFYTCKLCGGQSRPWTKPENAYTDFKSFFSDSNPEIVEG